MSYGVAAALQQAVYQSLLADNALDVLISGAIYDAVPPGVLPDIYVSLGEEEARDKSDQLGGGAEHRFVVSVIENGAGFSRAKSVAAAISDVLDDADLSLSRGHLVFLHFHRARATREQTGDLRRIDLTFHARVDDS